MPMKKNTLVMNNGLEIPKKAFGTWNLMTDIKSVIRNALEVGYRHFDFALCYENEAEIGKVFNEIFSEGKIKREDLFFTSKLWNTYQQDVEKGITKTLRDLRLDYLDLYLVHWPVNIKPNEEMNSAKNEKNETILRQFDIEKLWPNMEKLVAEKKVRSIGVSNFGIENIKNLLSIAKIKPVCNQIEVHPFLQQKNLTQYCKQNHIIISSYSSLRSIPEVKRGEIGRNLLEISERKNIGLASIIINFLLKQGYVVITKTATIERIKENFKEIELSENEIRIIESTKEERRYVDPIHFGKDRFK